MYPTALSQVGVVGRTGSGKSSLLVALTRLVAPPLRSGTILLDGEEIGQLPLLAYRSTIGVIPQEAALFEGTIRFNLDPLGRHTTKELWRALQRVQLTHQVCALSKNATAHPHPHPLTLTLSPSPSPTPSPSP